VVGTKALRFLSLIISLVNTTQGLRPNTLLLKPVIFAVNNNCKLNRRNIFAVSFPEPYSTRESDDDMGKSNTNMFLNFKACSLYAMYMLLSLKCVDKLDSPQKITFAQYFLVLDCLLLVALKHKRACRLLNNL